MDKSPNPDENEDSGCDWPFSSIWNEKKTPWKPSREDRLEMLLLTASTRDGEEYFLPGPG
jgi:hypothetical protein